MVPNDLETGRKSARLILTCHLSLRLRMVAIEILQLGPRVGPAELLDLAEVSKASGGASMGRPSKC